METKEAIEEYVSLTLNDNVEFQCTPVQILRSRANKRQKVFRVEFRWEKDGRKLKFSRRAKSVELPALLKGYIEEVNRISSS